MTKHTPPSPNYFRFILVIGAGDADGPLVEEVPFISTYGMVEHVLGGHLEPDHCIVGAIAFEVVGERFNACPADLLFAEALMDAAQKRFDDGRSIPEPAVDYLQKFGLVSGDQAQELISGKTRGEIDWEQAVDREIDRRLGK